MVIPTDSLFYQDNAKTDAPVFVILHGLFGSSPNFTGLAKALDKNYRVIRIDLRNHGKSFHAVDMRYHTLAADVVNTLDVLGVERCVLLGHSMGGKVAMQLAHDAPERLNSLIVVDIAPKTYPSNSHASVLDAMNSLPLAQITSRGVADEHLAKSLAEPMLRQFLLTNLQRSSEGFCWRVNLAVIIDEYKAIAAAPEIPTAFDTPSLFIRGGASDYILDEDEAYLAQHFTQASFETIAGAGHWLHAEAPQEFWAIVARFLGR